MRSEDTYRPLAEFFGLSLNDRYEETTGGRSRWDNLIQNSRQHLVDAGLLDHRDRGIWTLTSQGILKAEKIVRYYQKLGACAPA